MQDLIDIYREFLGVAEIKEKNFESEALLALAKRQSLEPIVARHLSKKIGLERYLARQAMMEKEFGILVDFLEEHKVSALFFKGIVLGKTLYEKPVLRPCRDIDILVQKADRDSVLEIFKNRGYVPKYPFSKAELRLELLSQPALEFYHPEREILVDIHWSIGRGKYGQSLNTKELFKRAANIQLYGRSIATLSKEDTLLALAVNASRDLWQKLQFIGDFYLLVAANPSLQIDKVFALAKKENSIQVLSISIALVRECLQIPFLVDTKINKESEDIAKRLYSYLLDEKTSISEAQEFKLELKIRERKIDKLKNILARVCLPHDKDFQKNLPEGLSFLYFVIKPVKTILRAVRVCCFKS